MASCSLARSLWELMPGIGSFRSSSARRRSSRRRSRSRSSLRPLERIWRNITARFNKSRQLNIPMVCRYIFVVYQLYVPSKSFWKRRSLVRLPLEFNIYVLHKLHKWIYKCRNAFCVFPVKVYQLFYESAQHYIFAHSFVPFIHMAVHVSTWTARRLNIRSLIKSHLHKINELPTSSINCCLLCLSSSWRFFCSSTSCCRLRIASAARCSFVRNTG